MLPPCTPSMITSGELPPLMERLPRMRRSLPLMSRPEMRPCMAEATLVVGVWRMTSDLTEATEPVRSRFFTVPKPITTTSSSSFDSGTIFSERAAPGVAFTVIVLYPM